MELRELGRTGLKVSPLGYGGAPLGGMYGTLDEAEAIAAVRHAIDAGINLVDTSPYYGPLHSEILLGKALRDGWRRRIILATKCGRIDKAVFDFSAEFIVRSMEDSLRRLETDHVDIFQAHDIEFADDLDRVFTETAEALYHLKKQGKCRFVGMTGLPLDVLKRAVESCDLDVIISYCHFTLLDTTLVGDLLPVAQQRGVGIINASPLAMGLLTNDGPPPWHPADAEIKEAARKAAALCRQGGSDLSTLALAWVLREKRLATTLVGMTSRAEVDRNLRAMKSAVDEALLAEVERVLAPVKDRTWPSGKLA
jgi:L-galactose dehydrogenase